MRNGIRPLRGIFLLLLLAIVVFGFWVLRQDVSQSLVMYASSPDRSRFAAITYHEDKQNYLTLTIWEISSGRKIATRKLDNAVSFTYSHDGRQLLIAPNTGPIQLLDADTLREISKINVDSNELIIRGTLPNAAVVVSKKNSSVIVVEVPSGNVIEQFSNAWQAVVSKDGKTMVVGFNHSKADVPFGHWTVYRADDRQFERVCNLPPEIGRVSSLSPSGLHAECWSLGTNQPLADVNVVDLTTGHIEFKRPSHVAPTYFIDDHRLLVNQPMSVQIVDAATGEVETSTRVSPDLFILGHSVQDSYWNSFQAKPQPIRLYDWRVGKVVATLPMSESTFYICLTATCVLFAVWACLWIAMGVKFNDWHPAWDVVVVHAVILLGLIVRFTTTGSQADQARVAAWMLYGHGIALTCLGLLWAVHGPRHWLHGVTIIIASVASMMGVVIFVWEGSTHTTWQITIGSLSFVGCLVGTQVILRRRGYRIKHREAGELREPPVSKRQVTLRDMLFFSGGTCMLFAVARFFVPISFEWWLYLFLILNGVTYAAVACVSVWAAFGKMPWWLRMAVLFAVSTAGAVTIVAFFHTYWIMPWWWYLVVHELVAVCMLGTLLVFRWHGFRLIRSVETV